MTTTQNLTTAEAAHQAGVTTSTIRTWARYGAVAATKTRGRWAIDTESLAHRIALPALLRAAVIDLTAFRDAKTAKTKATDLIEQNAIVPGPDRGLYLTPSSDGTNFYLVDTNAGTCTCKGHTYSGHCYHAVAAALIEARPTARFATAA